MRRLILLLLAMTIGAVPAQAAGPLVLAAASLQESLSAAADAWAKAGYERPTLSFAASSALARQILAGAPADLFVSADEAWMDTVAKGGGIVPASRRALLTNELVLVAPVTSARPVAIRAGFPLAAWLGAGKLAMGDPSAVPAGLYGREALTRLGVWDGVSGKVARAENVRAALALVERGEAPYGIVYRTDALVSKAVKVVGIFPAASHRPIVYPAALLASARSPEAGAFLRFLSSPTAQAIFHRYGFGTP